MNRSGGSRTHKRVSLANCFQAVFHYRGPSLLPLSSVGGRALLPAGCLPQVAAVGIEPTSRRFRAACPYQHRPRRIIYLSNCEGRNRTCGPVVQSNGFLPTETSPHRAKGRAGLEPAQWCLTGTCSATELPTQIKSALRESNPPVQLGRLAPLPLGQGHV